MTSRGSKILLSLLLVGVSLNLHAIDRVKITNGEWPPYLSEGLPQFGSVSKIVFEAFAREGIEVTYGFFPWVRAYEQAREGTEWEATVIWSKSDERAQSFYFSDSVLTLEDKLFYKQGNEIEWSKISDLSDKTIGLTRGYFYGDDWKRAEDLNIIRTDRVTSDLLNFKKLLRGRIDAFIVSEGVGLSLLKEHFSAEERCAFGMHPKPTRSVGFHVLISKQSPNARELIESFNRGLKKLRAEKRVEEILQQFDG